MKDLVIFGAGGFGREIQWLIERINEVKDEWNILGYIDDGINTDFEQDGYKVLGNTEWLLAQEKEISVACAIGNAKTRKRIIEKMEGMENLSFPNLIDPSVQKSQRITMGKGNLICAGTIATVDIKIGDFNIINLDCTIGHDVVLDSFVTVYPSVNISGCVEVGECSELGTGSQIIQGKKIGVEVIVGAGSVIVKDIITSGTYVGIPARKLEK